MMNDKERNLEMTPFRMQVLMDVAARAVKIMVTGAWALTFDEMDLVLDYIRQGIEEARKKNEADKEEYLCFVKQEN